ncbi:hypothetical protein [uncultured Bacteroides sp.]|uniref:hypothetical protein n=1 Tax=uncultured Bacteroides sp. TaxID=162156 RepID=UPI0025E14051|nr:hypothetical protein [uncultured Bacteroides sp.]
MHHLRHGVELGGAGGMNQSPHLFFRQSVAGHRAEHQHFVIVGNVAQMRRQTVEFVVALALHRFATREAEPLGDDVRIRDAFEVISYE